MKPVTPLFIDLRPGAKFCELFHTLNAIATIVNMKQNLSSYWKKSDEQFATGVTGQRRRKLSKKLKSKILMRMKNPLPKLMSMHIQSDHPIHPIHPIHPKRQRVTNYTTDKFTRE